MFDEIVTRLEHVPPKLLKKLLSGIVWEGTPDANTMAVTFDDGPDPDVTPAVLDSCDEAGIRATFFMLGEQVAKHPGVARTVADRGHCIGCHSMTHRSLFLAGQSEVGREIDDALALIGDATGMSPRWFRPPYGLFDRSVIGAVRERGLTMVLWTVLAGDYSDDSPETVLDRIDRFIAPGSIIVFHDTGDGGGIDLPDIVRETGVRARQRSIRTGGVDDLSLSDEIELEESQSDE